MGRGVLVIAVIAALMLPAHVATAASAPFLWLPVDGNPYISYYVYDAWTLRNNLPTYQNITFGVAYQHSGTDYSIPRGTPVYAAADGTVTEAADGFPDGCNKNSTDGYGEGNHVWIRHANGFLTMYFHMQTGSILVHQGQTVTAGQQIGSSSNSGNTFGGACGGYHLHFEVRDASFNVANPYNTDTGFLFVTDPPVKATAPYRPRCDSTATPVSTIYLPNITKTLGGPEGWDTPFVVQNSGGSPATFEFTFYRFSDGARVTCGKYTGIAPGAALADDPNADADLADNTQFSAVVRSFGSSAVAMVNQAQGSGAATEALSYSGATTGATKVYLPNVTRRFYGYDVPFIVQNMGSSATTATASFTSLASPSCPTPHTYAKSLSIAAGVSGVVDPNAEAAYTGAPASGLMDGCQYSVVVTSTQPVSVVVNAHNEAGSPVAYSHNGLANGATALYAPYAAKSGPGGRYSPIVLQNTSSAPVDATLAFTPLGGGAPQSFTLTSIAAGASRAFDPRFAVGTTTPCASASSTCLGAGEYGLRITATGAVAAVVLPVTDTTAAAYVAQSTPGTHAYLPNAIRSAADPTGWTTPLVIQSAGATTATMQWYANPSGTLAKTQTLLLTSNASTWLDPATVSGLPDGRYSVVINANGPIATIAYELGTGGDSAMIYEGFAGP